MNGDSHPAGGGNGRVAPATESIHLPEPSLLPVATAAGLAAAGAGLFAGWPIAVAGGVLTLVCVKRWLRGTRDDIARLPLGR